MDGMMTFIGFWGHAAVGFGYAALAIWLFHKYGSRNRQQILLISAMAATSLWGVAAIVSGPLSLPALWAESARNLAWLCFMFFLLKSGEGKEQPRTINMIYAVLLIVLLCQPVNDAVVALFAVRGFNTDIAVQSAMTLRMIYAVGALVVVHNLYTVSAPEARWGISLPMAALAAMWTYDLNLYTIGYITAGPSDELIQTRGFATALLAPVFVIAARRNSNWGLRLSRSVAFRSVSLVAIAVYMFGMVVLATALEIVGGTYVRLAQITLIFGMSLTALLVLPSGRFKSWLNVVIAKNFFQHRYDYRSEWMRFADTIGFPSKEAAPFYERVIKSLADIFDSPGGLLLVPDEEDRLTLQARWNWATANVPAYCVTSVTMPFFESTGHIVSMDQIRDGTDDRCDPRAIPQWLFEETQAWAVVPLVHFGRLAGLVILSRPRLPRALDWEDLDMLRVVGRQLASYLAEAASQQALAESQQFEQFNRRFAFVAHDIKNLVSQLSILARNAERHAEKPEFRVDMIDTLRSSVDKMNELLARLSQHNKARQSAPIVIDIGEAVMKAVHDKRLIYPIEAEFKSGLLATADPARVETIIGHLVQNAIEATGDGSPVQIKCNMQGNDIAVHITDKGVGMTEMFISKLLFKPFESTKEGGFGIGAYEARALALSMGGQLRVDSKPGKGTTFTLLLPKAAEAQNPVNMDEAA